MYLHYFNNYLRKIFALILLVIESTNSFAMQIVFRERSNPLNTYNDEELICRFRTNRGIFKQFDKLLSLLRYTISYHSTSTLTQMDLSFQSVILTYCIKQKLPAT